MGVMGCCRDLEAEVTLIGEELGGFPEEVTSEWHLEGRVGVHHTEKGEGFLVGVPGSGLAACEGCGGVGGDEAAGRPRKALPEGPRGSARPWPDLVRGMCLAVG